MMSEGLNRLYYPLLPLLVVLLTTSAECQDQAKTAEPFIKSLENQCAVASVYTILRKQGFELNPKDIASGVKLSVYGSNMADIQQFIESFGLKAIALEGAPSNLQNAFQSEPRTAALLDFGNHWVAATNYKNNFFEILEFPKKFLIHENRLNEFWTGKCLLVTPTDVYPELSRSANVAYYSIFIILTLGSFLFSTLVLTRPGIAAVFRLFLLNTNKKR